jgi:hypothetical protein
MADPIPDFPYVLQNGPGNMPDADQVMANYEHLRDWLNARLGNLSDKQILIANASGQIVGRTLGGDATISNTGTLTIANDAVDTAQIVDDAVNAAKIAAGAVGASEIAADAVGNSELADNAVDSANIVAGAVTNGKAGFVPVQATAAAAVNLSDSYGAICTLANGRDLSRARRGHHRSHVARSGRGRLPEVR